VLGFVVNDFGFYELHVLFARARVDLLIPVRI
jgi:hypothetical protein